MSERHYLENESIEPKHLKYDVKDMKTMIYPEIKEETRSQA